MEVSLIWLKGATDEERGCVQKGEDWKKSWAAENPGGGRGRCSKSGGMEQKKGPEKKAQAYIGLPHRMKKRGEGKGRDGNSIKLRQKRQVGATRERGGLAARDGLLQRRGD